MRISACLITRDEEQDLPRCLASIAPVADEIVVVDSGSTDRTPAIAAEFGARFVPHDWEGFVAQKNLACSLARHDWVLSIDADEELSAELREAIRARKQRPDAAHPDAYAVSRVVYFEGRWVRFGDWYPDVLPRLFRRARARFVGGRVHERLEVDGRVERLQGELHHFTFHDWADYRARVETYSRLWAEDARERGRRARRLDPLLHAGWRLLRSLLLKSAWRGGRFGWRLALAQASEALVKYRTLLEEPPPSPPGEPTKSAK